MPQPIAAEEYRTMTPQQPRNPNMTPAALFTLAELERALARSCTRPDVQRVLTAQLAQAKAVLS